MSDFLTSLVAVVAVLGFMILIHEFGHYAVAKWLGVRVEQFAIGFGKRLIGFRKGETDYRINAIPLGGYVKMSGENPMDQRTDDPREFLNHSRWHRFLIAIAGPAMNILLAISPAHYRVHGALRISSSGRPGAGDRMGVEGYGCGESRTLKLATASRESTESTIRHGSRLGLKEMLSPGQPLDVQVERERKVARKDGRSRADAVSIRSVLRAGLRKNKRSRSLTLSKECRRTRLG